MKNLSIFTYFAIICCISNIAVPKQMEMVGTIVDDNDKFLPKVYLRLLPSGSLRSDDKGVFKCPLPLGFGRGSEITFVAENVVVNGVTLVVFEPTGGIWEVVHDTLEWNVRIKLLPKGDLRLLGEDGKKHLIEMMVAAQTQKYFEQLQQMAIENGELKEKLRSLEEADHLKEEAERTGFREDTVSIALEKMNEESKQGDNPYMAALYEKNFPQAEMILKKSIEAREQIREGNTDTLQEEYIRLSDAYIGQGKLKEAETAYRKVIELRPEDVSGYFNLAKVLYIRGNLRGALENLQSSLGYYPEGGDRLQLAHIKNNLGFLILSVGDDPEQAIVNFIQARAIYEEYNSEFEQLAIYNNLTLAYNRTKNHKEALRIGGEGLEYSENRFRFTISLLFEDDLNEKMISDSLVQEFSGRQIPFSDSIDFHVSPDGQSWILVDNNNNKKYFIKKSENWLVVYQYPGLYAQLNNNIGCAYDFLSRREKKEENLELAIKAFKDALEIRQKSVFPLGYAKQNFNLGWAYEHLDNEEQNENLDKALEFYNKALYAYRGLDLPDKVQKVKKRIEIVER